MHEKTSATLGWLLICALATATLLITPLTSLDPINPIKMLAISIFGFASLGVLMANKKTLKMVRYKPPLFLISGFVVWQIIVFVFSGGERFQQLFGSNGRNTGIITYFSFAILFVASMIASSKMFFQKFLGVVLIVGVASIGYGLIQSVGADPIEWASKYSLVFGFLGNPNFQSSLLGILGVFVFTQILSDCTTLRAKFLISLYLIATVYVVKESESVQGFLILLIGLTVSSGIYFKEKSLVFRCSYVGLSIFTIIAGLMGTLNKGFLAQFLYQDSVTYRGDYWRAGWKMTLDNPIFGVGLDSYGDWYRRSRTLEATLRRGPDVTSNAAHNVYLDISSSGGFPLLMIYVAIMATVLVCAIKVIRREGKFNSSFVGLFASWIAYQIQSTISINQIGLGVWGWVLSGLIIGYEVNTRDDEKVLQKGIGKRPTKQNHLANGTAFALLVGAVMGTLIGMPPYIASAKFAGALESNNAEVIRKAAYIWPVDSSHMIQVAIILNDNNFEDQGLKVALDGVEKFPDNYAAWSVLNSMKKATEAHKVEALSQMKRLDPLNPNL